MRTKTDLTPSPATFRKRIRQYYKAHGRVFPWRTTRDPYKIFVSEIMLQQTQTERVKSYYTKFLATFPTFHSLAQADTQVLLSHWKGLGYNRRALFMRQAAQVIVSDYQGKLPSDEQSLRMLPGVGSYTAQALRAFVFNLPVVMIETNIRTVIIHEYYSRQKIVSDAEVEQVLRSVLPRTDFKHWYYALMDYGVYLKQQGVTVHRKSAQYVKQKSFKGSRRQFRGKILELLLSQGSLTLKKLALRLSQEHTFVEELVNELIKEGFLVRKGQVFNISR